MALTTTYLEILSPADLKPKRLNSSVLRIAEAVVKQWQFNRFMYSLVGHPWSWIDKTAWTDDQWAAYAEADNLRTFGAYFEGSPAGYFEIQKNTDVEIAYFGLAPKFIGRGYGAALLTAAIEEGFRWDARRVWVHTCDRDHPAAIPNYISRGMKIYKVETTE